MTLLGFLNSFLGAQQSPPVAAQDLVSVFKAGYLEKRRKGGCMTQNNTQNNYYTIHFYGTKSTRLISLKINKKMISSMLRLLVFPPQITAFLAQSGRRDGVL